MPTIEWLIYWLCSFLPLKADHPFEIFENSSAPVAAQTVSTDITVKQPPPVDSSTLSDSPLKKVLLYLKKYELDCNVTR